MTEPVEPISSAPAQTVEEDVPCRKCAYNLRGLSHAGQCPECGMAVQLSIGGDLIRFSDPQWVAGLSKGVRLIVWSIIVMVVAAAIAVVSGAGRASHPPVPYQSVQFLGGLLEYWGSWLLTEPDPSGLGEAEYRLARRIVRLTLMIALAAALLGFVHGLAATPPAVAPMFTTISLVGSVANLVGYIAQLHYLQRLALRIPRPKLSMCAGAIKKGVGWTCGIIVAIGVVMSAVTAAIPGAARGSKGTELLGCFAEIVGLMLLIYGLRYVDLLLVLNEVLKAQLAVARKLWSAKTTDGA